MRALAIAGIMGALGFLGVSCMTYWVGAGDAEDKAVLFLFDWHPAWWRSALLGGALGFALGLAIGMTSGRRRSVPLS